MKVSKLQKFYLISKEYGKLFQKIFDWRTKGDYGDLFDFEQNDIEPLFEPVEKLIKIISNKIINIH